MSSSSDDNDNDDHDNILDFLGPKKGQSELVSKNNQTKKLKVKSFSTLFGGVTKPAQASSLNIRQTRSATPSIAEKLTFESKPRTTDALIQRLGFNLKDSLNTAPITAPFANVLQNLKSEDEIREMVDIDQRNAINRLAEYDSITKMIRKRLDTQFFEDRDNAAYIENLRDSISNGDIDKVIDFYPFTESDDIKNEAQNDSASRQQQIILEEFIQSQTFTLPSNVPVKIQQKRFMSVLETTKSIPRLKFMAALQNVNMEMVFFLSKINGYLSADANFLYEVNDTNEKKKESSDAILLLDRKKKTCTAVVLSLRTEVLVNLLTSPTTVFIGKKSGDIVTAIEHLLTRVIVSMVDSKANTPRGSDYVFNEWEIDSTLSILNKQLVKLSHLYFKHLSLDRGDCFRELCLLIIKILEKYFSKEFQLIVRFLYNLRLVAVPLIKNLKNWLMLFYLVTEDYNDLNIFEDDVISYEAYKKTLITFKLHSPESSNPDPLSVSLYHFVTIFSRSELRGDTLKVYKHDDNGQSVDQADYKVNKKVYENIRCRFKLLQILIIGNLKSLRACSTVEHHKENNTGNPENDKLLNSLYETFTPRLPKGMLEEDAALYAIKSLLTMIKGSYFSHYKHMIVPIITDCVSNLTATISRIDRELTAPELVN
ncbi:hypothetical protein CANARDRAFT_23407 [[Candida] arabinofermentans NRRL YB-2248]|uniref:Uncharacterized protein n=1 Tax=[Candida] arabinofermentans NRRL YB-2248 TaxID=983967 RepID=A0A1E4T0T3_9ASCO|nr:hypothetical protein CANARDRAFT_23407 [[Candida] arabinofermentans NRRL YB-2248]